jgi:hypothetical protein
VVKRPRPLSDDDFENVDSGAVRPYLPLEGCYVGQFIEKRHHPSGRWGEKLEVSWLVFLSPALDTGNSTILPRYYNITRNEQGRLVFGNHHDYRKDYVAANAGRRPLVWNRLPITIFEKGKFLIEVVTVRRDGKGSLPPALYYSRVNRIVRPLLVEDHFEAFPFKLVEATE